jgi:hypothetical protein
LAKDRGGRIDGLIISPLFIEQTEKERFVQGDE